MGEVAYKGAGADSEVRGLVKPQVHAVSSSDDGVGVEERTTAILLASPKDRYNKRKLAGSSGTSTNNISDGDLVRRRQGCPEGQNRH